jgi:hypothetical protein
MRKNVKLTITDGICRPSSVHCAYIYKLVTNKYTNSTRLTGFSVVHAVSQLVRS